MTHDIPDSPRPTVAPTPPFSVGSALPLHTHAPPHCALLLALAACGGPQAPAASPQPHAPQPHAPPQAAPPPPGEPIAEYVVAAYADSKGVLWFGTMGKGVARLDGDALTYLSPAGGKGGDVVASIAEDRRGDLWFAGHDGTGLCKYDGVTFTQLWEEETRVTVDRDGTIWAGTRRGVLRADGDRFTEFPVPLDDVTPAYTISPGRVAMALHDSRGHWWFRSDGYGVVRHDGRDFTRLTKQDGLCSDTVWNIVEDRAGRVWLSCVQAYQPAATGDGGLRMYDGAGFTAFPEIKGLTGNDIYTLRVDRAGDLWIGATGVGVYRYDGAAFTLISATDRPDLNAGFGLQAMTEDRRGVLWFGFSGGLFRLDGERFVHVPRSALR